MTADYKTTALILMSLSLLSVSAACGTDADIPSPLEFDDADMRTFTVEAGAAWNSLDTAVQQEFIDDYRNRENVRELYDEYIETIGGAAILDYLELNNPLCHGEAHALGNAIFADSQDINLSLRICGNRCTSACMHGVVKYALGSHSGESIQAVMNDFCGQAEMGRLHKPGNCAHGIGHALMLRSEHDIADSLDSCRGFREPSMDYYCATGVFMEYRDMLTVKERLGKPVNRPGLQYPCDTNTEYPAACYRYMMRLIEEEIDADQSTLIELCLDLPSNLKAGCFHGLGAMYSRTVADHPEIFADLCSHGDEVDQILCVEGVIEKMADFDQRHALEVCTRLSGEMREICVAGAEEQMYRLDKPTMTIYTNGS